MEGDDPSFDRTRAVRNAKVMAAFCATAGRKAAFLKSKNLPPLSARLRSPLGGKAEPCQGLAQTSWSRTRFGGYESDNGALIVMDGPAVTENRPILLILMSALGHVERVHEGLPPSVRLEGENIRRVHLLLSPVRAIAPDLARTEGGVDTGVRVEECFLYEIINTSGLNCFCSLLD